MVTGMTKNYPSIYLCLSIFKDLNLIDFGTCILLAYERHSNDFS